jgi:hypothetical protein
MRSHKRKNRKQKIAAVLERQDRSACYFDRGSKGQLTATTAPAFSFANIPSRAYKKGARHRNESCKGGSWHGSGDVWWW